MPSSISSLVCHNGAVRLTVLFCLSAQLLLYLAEYRNVNVLLHMSTGLHREISERYPEPGFDPDLFTLTSVRILSSEINQSLANPKTTADSIPPVSAAALSSGPSINPMNTISIDDLVNTSNYTASDCGPDLMYIEDIVVPTSWNRRIPMVVHVTGKTRCLTKPFMDNLERWKLKNHSFYFHDEESVDRLLQEYWHEFPQLQIMQHCMVSGAAKADLWRYLILYRYGGIYADMDSAPGDLFFTKDNSTTIISSDDDAFFEVERIGVLSQYFMAASPKHPIMFLAVQQVFARLMDTDSIGHQYVPYVTGPGALKTAFIRFMGETSGGIVSSGIYTSPTNRSLTVVGKRRSNNQYIRRESLNAMDKKRGYELMGMKHFSRAGDPKLNTSCYLHLYHVANSEKDA
ncbi:glycosyltransferase sugar-binding protein containing DXD motif [Nitzschia inconspicua]|uniref:Glycosyltransferase sugar-binding protein containing DXD motif n=1 Tax=Nitzschia inconspicua TaxID=303405 RepID=A0A9K3PCK7_9STRA|nr:glycosyltransferase sugar-binding protein containing DXD motif [Nitzschia inconspicua]